MINQIINNIISGNTISKSTVVSYLSDLDLKTLCNGANTIRNHFLGNKANLCTIINGKAGNCSEDCKYCAQSKHNKSVVKTTGFLSEKIILKDAKYNEKRGINNYSIVTAGRSLTGDDFIKAVNAYKYIHNSCNLKLCASHGLLDYNQLVELRAAGVSRYHCNIETSERYFKKICTTHTYEDKLNTIKFAKKAGLEICSGGIIGMKETLEDRIDMAFTLADLDVDSIPINILMPIKGTSMENYPPLSKDEILRTIAIFRYINPTAEIRLAAGRISMDDLGKEAFLSGANATITGDMLTTTGTNIEDDKNLLESIGFCIQ